MKPYDALLNYEMVVINYNVFVSNLSKKEFKIVFYFKSAMNSSNRYDESCGPGLASGWY